MDLVTPAIGLVFWTTVTFVILLVVLRKFAWKPILTMVKEREQSIEESLAEADKARKEMEQLKADNDRILKEARQERETILKEAREMKENIIGEAKEKAGDEANNIVAQAREQIQNEKMAVLTDLKNQVAEMSIEIAEKVLEKELESKDKQSTLVKDQLAEFKFN